MKEHQSMQISPLKHFVVASISLDAKAFSLLDLNFMSVQLPMRKQILMNHMFCFVWHLSWSYSLHHKRSITKGTKNTVLPECGGSNLSTWSLILCTRKQHKYFLGVLFFFKSCACLETCSSLSPARRNLLKSCFIFATFIASSHPRWKLF